MLKIEKKRFTSYLREDLHEQLKELNKETHVPIAAYINEAVEDLLKKHQPKKKK